MTQDKNNLQTPKHLFHGLKFHHRCEVVVDLKAPRPPHMPDSEDRMLMSGVSIHAIISSIVCEYFSVAQCLQNWHEVAISYGHLPSYWWYLHEAIAHVKLVRGNLYYWCDRFKTLQEDSFLLNICSIVVSLLSAMKPVKSEVDDFHLSSHRRIFKLVLNSTTTRATVTRNSIYSSLGNVRWWNKIWGDKLTYLHSSMSGDSCCLLQHSGHLSRTTIAVTTAFRDQQRH